MTITLKAIARKMAGINIAQFATKGTHGWLNVRPMSNNGEVEYDGTSFYFAYRDASVVRDIERDDQVTLSFESTNGFYVSVQGKARVSEDPEKLAAHWVPALDAWFPDGLQTPDVVMIEVKARHLHYWDTSDHKMEMGALDL